MAAHEDVTKGRGATETAGPSGGAPAEADRLAAHALGVQIVGVHAEGPVATSWRAERADGQPVALVVVRAETPEAEREAFAAAAGRVQGLADVPRGVLRVLEVDPSRRAIMTDLWTIGCARELPALGWPVRRRLDFMRRAALALDSLHQAGIIHGCLTEDNVLLDDAFDPVLSEAGSVSVRALVERTSDVASYVAFAAPEVLEGAAPDIRSDVFSMGRLVQNVFKEDDLSAMTQIVGKCLAPSSFGRYASASEIATAIGTVIDELPAGQPTLATPGAPPARLHRPAEKNDPPPVFEKETAPAPPKVPPRWLTPAGVAVALLAVGLAFVLGGANASLRTALSVALFAGGALAAWGVRPGSRTPVTLRIGFALSCGALLLAVDPLVLGYQVVAARALRGDAARRRAAIEEIVARGRDFRGLSLAGLDLSDHDFRGADLRGVDLSGADLSRSTLWGAMLEGVRLGDANLSGADLRGVDLAGARNVDLAKCSQTTLLPKPWRCTPVESSGGGRLSTVEIEPPRSLEAQPPAR